MNKIGICMLSVALMLCANLTQAQSVRIDAQEQDSISIGHVEQVQMLEGHPMMAKLMVLQQGDPALNGMHLFLSVNQFSSGTGPWNVFFLKDVADYQVLPSQRAGFLKIQLKTDTLNDEGFAQTQRSVLFVNMTQAAEKRGFIEVEEVHPKQ